MSENEGAGQATDADASGDPGSTDDEERSNVDESGDRSAATDGSSTEETTDEPSTGAETTDGSSTMESTDGSSMTTGVEERSDSDGADADDVAGDADADDAAGAADADADADGVGAESDSGGSLAERVDEASTDQLAGEIAALRDRVESLETAVADREETIEELESKLKRKQADFQNFKKRQERQREEERQRATEDLVERLLDVRDNLVRALDQDEGSDIRGGVETTLRQFDRVFDAEDVRTIDPDPGTDVDPRRHEVLVRVESDQEAGTVADLHRPGYEMAGKVLRPAQVTVADEEEE